MLFLPEYDDLDALDLSAWIRQKKISPEDVLRAAIERIESRNPLINAVITTFYDKARLRINKIDKEAIFSGVPFLLKDLLVEYKNTPLQSGSRLTKGRISAIDSELVKRVHHAGLIVLGKTNTPEFGVSPVTEPALTGPTKNPWDLTKNSGGSSGGAAAAVSARIVPIAHANDGGGSIRIPSAWCGTFGLKVSRGRNPTGTLLIRIWQDMVVEHAISRSVRDSAAMLDVLAGQKEGFFSSLPKPSFSFLDHLKKPLKTLKIAYTTVSPFGGHVNGEWADACKKTAEVCQSLGHHIEEKPLPYFNQEMIRAFMIVMAAELAAGIDVLSESLGQKLNRKKLEVLTDLIYESSGIFSAKDFAWAVHILEKTASCVIHYFKNFDILITPTAAQSAPLLGSFNPSGIENYLLKFLRFIPNKILLRKLFKKMGAKTFDYIPFTALFNISGQPACSLPLFWDKQNMPIGTQCVARIGDEGTLLQLAHQLEEALPWQNKKPVFVK